MRQAALDTNFGGAELPGLDGLLRDLFGFEKIGIGFARATAEGAELTAHKTDVGEIDVAIDYISDDVTDEFDAQQIRGCEQAQQVGAFGMS